ncbi:MAG: hypothetical protein WCT20_05485 [Candidatus Babeliales bacterium]
MKKLLLFSLHFTFLTSTLLGTQNQAPVLAEQLPSATAQQPAALPQQVPNNVDAKLKKYKFNAAKSLWSDSEALLYGEQHLKFEVFFRDKKWRLKSQKLTSTIKSIGPRADASLTYNLIFFTNHDFDYTHCQKEIQLGIGITANFSLFFIKFLRNIHGLNPAVANILNKIGIPLDANFTYVPFLNAPGGMIIIGVGAGVGLGASLVYGGSIVPVKDEIKQKETSSQENAEFADIAETIN